VSECPSGQDVSDKETLAKLKCMYFLGDDTDNKEDRII